MSEPQQPREKYAFTVRFVILRDDQPVEGSAGQSGLITVTPEFLADAIAARGHLARGMAQLVDEALTYIEAFKQAGMTDDE